MRKIHTKMWHKLVGAVAIAIVSAVSIVYVTYFMKPSTETILSNNKRHVGRMSRKTLEDDIKNGVTQSIDIQIAQYQQEKWTAWLELMNYVSVGEMYDKCEGDDRIMLGQVILLPDKKFGGVKTKIYSNFTLHDTVSDGVIHLEVKYNDVQIFKNHWPLCDAEESSEEKVIFCPLEPGRKRFIKNMKVPNYLPKGKYWTKAWAVMPNGQLMGCAFCEFVL